MSTHLKEKEEKILELLIRLREESERGTPLVVEGKKDVETLRTLGMQGQIITAKTGGKSVLDVLMEIEETQKSQVILLLDFDRRGAQITRRLIQFLEKTRTKPNTLFRRELKALVSTEVKDIEGLAKYIENLGRKANPA